MLYLFQGNKYYFVTISRLCFFNISDLKYEGYIESVLSNLQQNDVYGKFYKQCEGADEAGGGEKVMPYAEAR